MKIKNQLTKYLFFALTLVFAMSCGQTTNSESEEHSEGELERAEGMAHDEAANDNMEGMGHNDNDDGDEHDMANMGHDEMMGEGFTYMPGKESMSMMEYKTDNIRVATSGDEDVLLFEPAGQKASCMFKNKQGNVGVTATLKMESPDAKVMLLHHSTGKDNYEYVSLEWGVMKLGRVENGEEKIFDRKEVDVPGDWFTLTVTAAGTHYKGYLNEKMITHGHGDMMESGLLGIVASGNGSISIKKLEATPLEAEQ